MSGSKCTLLAGLGNPGEGYAQTRHNIGFLVIDALALKLGQALTKSRFDAAYVKTRAMGRDLFLVKPMAYMNRSGPPIQKLSAYFKIEMGDILVVHDDMDLPFGKIKIVQGRGAGGHNGVRSIIQAFGQKECVRIRVGVGHPDGRANVTGHVLGKFNPQEQADLDKVIQDAVEACSAVLESGVVKAMNAVNTRR